ncbi:MAG: hypothetical protein ACTSU5_13450 [Promethearchaeota archaeon]
MRLFVLKDEVFVESDSLYLHDVALFVDEAGKNVYYWQGPKAAKNFAVAGRAAWNRLRQSPRYGEFEFSEALATPDFELNRAINKYLGEHSEIERERDVRDAVTYAVITTTILGVFFCLFALVNCLFAFGFQRDAQGFLVSRMIQFLTYFDHARTFTLVSLAFFCTTLLLSSWKLRDGWITVTSLLAVLLSVGWYYLLKNDIFLVLFHNSDVGASRILLDPRDFAVFATLNAVVTAVVDVPVSARVALYYKATIAADKNRRSLIGDIESLGGSLREKIRFQPHVRYGRPAIIDLRKDKTKGNHC